MRSCFIAPDGHVFVYLDFSQIELCLAAMVAGDEALSAALASGDVYRATAALLFGIPIEQVTDEQRQSTKVFLLGSQYGGGPGVLRRTMMQQGRRMSHEEAEWYVKRYRRMFPAINSMRERAWDAAQSGCDVAVDLASGMQRLYRAREVSGNSLLATRVSSLGAVGLKIGLLLAAEAGLDRYLANCVRDELVAVAPEREAQEVAAGLMACMIEGMRPVAPTARIVAEPHIRRVWDKASAAQPTEVNEDGSDDELDI